MRTPRYRGNPGSVFALNYYLVWCPKYRRAVLTDSVSERLTELLETKAAELQVQLETLEIWPDHLRLFVSAPPTEAVQYLVNQFKGYTSRMLRQEFPHLRSRLPSLWTRSYYAGTVS